MFSGQVFTLRAIGQILDDEVRSKQDAEELIDFAQSVRLGQLANDLWTVPQPVGLEREMADAEAWASTMIERLRNEVADWEDALVSVANSFTREERRTIAKGQPVSAEIQQKMANLLLEATRDFMINNQQKQGDKPIAVRNAMSMFGFRYSLCVLLHTIMWMTDGAGCGKDIAKRVNDAIDLQIAAVGTFFEGVLSGDVQVKTVSWAARRILRSWGAYVGEDWQLPSLEHKS